VSFILFPFEQYSQPVDIYGMVKDISYSSHSRMHYCITLQTHSTITPVCSRPLHATLQIYVAHKPTFIVADHIILHNVQLKPPGDTDFRKYLIKQGVLASLFLTTYTHTLQHRPKYSFQRWIWQKRDVTARAIETKLSRKVYAFFCAVFLGNRTWNKYYVEKISDEFKQWGAVHYMVRAGLHLVSFVVIWHTLFQFIPLSFVLKQLTLLMICLLYYLLSWSSIAFLRAFLTFLMYKCALILNIGTHSLHTITLITLLVLITNPMHLFFLDFQLSFAVTFALAWFNHIYISPPTRTL
jgi:predicted membrane metal-binding protein